MSDSVPNLAPAWRLGREIFAANGTGTYVKSHRRFDAGQWICTTDAF